MLFARSYCNRGRVTSSGEVQEDTMKHRNGSTTKNQSTPSDRGQYTDTRHEDAKYWRSRAERTRNQSQRYKQPAVRDHFAEIAAGYDELARRAQEIEAEKDQQTRARQAELTETSDKHSSRSDQDRVRDALEDDEVREVLRANRRPSP
jgi:hypothetical protein